MPHSNLEKEKKVFVAISVLISLEKKYVYLIFQDRTTNRCFRSKESLVDGSDLEEMEIAADALGIKVEI